MDSHPPPSDVTRWASALDGAYLIRGRDCACGSATLVSRAGARRRAIAPGQVLAVLGPSGVGKLVPGPRVFDLMIAALLLPLGIWLAVIWPSRNRDPARPRRIPVPALVVLACLTGCIGGIYGIGGAAILSPILIGSGRPASEVAPAALASTFVTSLGGVVTVTILSVNQSPVAPNWPTGIALGIGGIIGGYTGARMQSRIPDAMVRRIVGILATAIAARYLWSGLS